MKVSTVIHNPGAGAEKYTKETLVSKMELLGYECRYSSTKKKGWKDIDADTDFIVIAGGDGTVRKVIKKLLDRKILRKRFPLALLPLGTANNISKTLGISGEPEELAKSWKKEFIRRLDIGFIDGLDEPNFFIEGLGYGLFPTLMETMKEKDDKLFLSLDTEINYSLQILHEMILSYEPQDLQLEIDGVDYSGKFLLAEVMNIKSVGPNLELAPNADTGDGRFEVIMVTEEQRNDFAEYIMNKLKGTETQFVPKSVIGTSIRMQANNTHIHIDDELIWVDDPAVIKIDVYEGLLKVFVPGQAAE